MTIDQHNKLTTRVHELVSVTSWHLLRRLLRQAEVCSLAVLQCMFLAFDQAWCCCVSACPAGEGAGAGEIKLSPNYVNGEFVPAASGKTIDVIDPATGKVCGKIPRSEAVDVEAGNNEGSDVIVEWLN